MQDTLSPLFGFPGRPILLVTQAEVTIRDLTVDGANSAEVNPALQGIVFLNAGGLIHANLVQNIGFGEPRLPLDENGEPDYQGDAIVVINFSAIPRTVTIRENKVVNFNNIGILVDAEADQSDPAIANLTAHLIENTVIGSGPNEVIDQTGMFIGGFGFADPQFSVTGTIRDNRVRDTLTVGSYPLPGVAVAVLNPYNLEIMNNNLEAANIGLAASQAIGAQIGRNQLVGPGPDVFGSAGLLLSGSDSFVFENRFRKLNAGILLMVEDAQLGSALNTAMKNNRFDNIAVDVMTGAFTSPAMAAVATTPTTPMLPMLAKLPHR
jgi:hypothetical protein